MLKGTCSKSNIPLKDHDKCEACHSYGYGGNSFEGIEYRGRIICGTCKETWETYHPEWDWNTFLTGSIPAAKWRERQKERIAARRANVFLLKVQGKTEVDIAFALGESRVTVRADLLRGGQYSNEEPQID